MASTTGGGDRRDISDLDLLREDYGERWDITVDDTGLIHATQKHVPHGGTEQNRWEWTVEALRRRLEAYEAEQSGAGRAR